MTIDEDLQDQFAGLGVEVKVTKQDDEEDDGAVRVWDSNWRSVRAFLGVSTQWRVVARGMTGILTFIGLDYAAVRAALGNCEDSDEIFADIQVMEAAALDTFAEAAEAAD